MRILSTKLFLSKRIRMNSDHTAYRSMIAHLDIIEPHVPLLCVPRFGWVILREDCLAHRAPLRSKSDRSFSRIELQVKGQLVSTRVLQFCSASAKSKFSIVDVHDDILNSYCHSPFFLCTGTDNSSCLRNRHGQLVPVVRAKVVSSTEVPVSQRNRVSRNENKISQLASRNENKLFHSASQIENNVSHSLSRGENKIFQPASRNENIDVRSVCSQK